MGLAGFAIAWARAESVLHLPVSVSSALAWLAAAVFALFAGVYALKATLHGAEVMGEFRHPVRINFFPAFSISLLLLSVVLLPRAPVVAAWMWMVGGLVHLSITLKAGVKVEVCALYRPYSGRAAADLLPGVTAAKPAEVAAWLLKPGVQTLVF